MELRIVLVAYKPVLYNEQPMHCLLSQEVVAKSQRFLLVGLLILMSIVIVAIAGALLFKR